MKTLQPQIDIFHDTQNRILAPTGIIQGPDQAIWFTSPGNNAIGRIHQDNGHIEIFNDPQNLMKMPVNIYPGKDQALWFTCIGSNHIGRIDPHASKPEQTITLFSHPELINPVAIKSDSNGYLWFSLRKANSIGRINTLAPNPHTTIEIFTHPKINSPAAIYITQQDKLFFTNTGNNTIGYLDCVASTPLDTITACSFPHTQTNLRAWAEDANGNLWLTTQQADGIAKIKTQEFNDSSIIEFYQHPALITPDGTCNDANNKLWLVLTESNQIACINPAANDPLTTLVTFSLPPKCEGPFDIKPGSNNSLWFTNKKSNSIGQVSR